MGLPDKIDSLIGGAARMLALRGDRELVGILTTSQCKLQVIEEGDWYTYYELRLIAPAWLFLGLDDPERTERRILEALQPALRDFTNEEVKTVALVLEPHPDKDWRQRANDWLLRTSPPPPPVPEHDYHVFICHASEDKGTIVRPLAAALAEQGVKVWYDEFVVKVGDSLRRAIDAGLSRSRFGIVVLSKAFFQKEWPQYELDGLVTREVAGRKVILPLWHGIGQSEVAARSPSLAAKAALSTSNVSLEHIVTQLVEVVLKA